MHQPTSTETISAEAMAFCCTLMRAMGATLGIEPDAVKAISVTSQGVMVETKLADAGVPTRVCTVFEAAA